MAHRVKHLYRSKDNKILAGICGGVGELIGMDPVILRLIWTLIVIFTGIFPGVLFYILAVFIVPEERTAS